MLGACKCLVVDAQPVPSLVEKQLQPLINRPEKGFLALSALLQFCISVELLRQMGNDICAQLSKGHFVKRFMWFDFNFKDNLFIKYQ